MLYRIRMKLRRLFLWLVALGSGGGSYPSHTNIMEGSMIPASSSQPNILTSLLTSLGERPIEGSITITTTEMKPNQFSILFDTLQFIVVKLATKETNISFSVSHFDKNSDEWVRIGNE